MAYSSSFTFYIDTVAQDCSLGDNLTFELISEYQPTGKNWTGSVFNNYNNTDNYLNLSLLPLGLGGYPFATSSVGQNGFITNVVSPNTIQFSTDISQFYGGDYTQLPTFASSSTLTVSSSLYNDYGDITYPFVMSSGDKILLQSYDGRLQIVSVKIANYTYGFDNLLSVQTYPDLNSYWSTYPGQISKILILKRLQDEQNIIMTFAKPPGETSYGFIIPENINLDVLNSISSIQANVQNQLLSTQQNSQ